MIELVIRLPSRQGKASTVERDRSGSPTMAHSGRAHESWPGASRPLNDAVVDLLTRCRGTERVPVRTFEHRGRPCQKAILDLGDEDFTIHGM
jgi:hypothetical protein